MGYGENNNYLKIHLTDSGALEYVFNRHRGDANVDTDSPAFSASDYAFIKSATTQIQFGARVQAISLAMASWWTALPSTCKTKLYEIVTLYT